jgi:hypothetical protein
MRNCSNPTGSREQPQCIDALRVTGNSPQGCANLLGKHPFFGTSCEQVAETRFMCTAATTHGGDNNPEQDFVDMTSAECDDQTRTLYGPRRPNSRFSGRFAIVCPFDHRLTIGRQCKFKTSSKIDAD